MSLSQRIGAFVEMLGALWNPEPVEAPVTWTGGRTGIATVRRCGPGLVMLSVSVSGDLGAPDSQTAVGTLQAWRPATESHLLGRATGTGTSAAAAEVRINGDGTITIVGNRSTDTSIRASGVVLLSQ